MPGAIIYRSAAGLVVAVTVLMLARGLLALVSLWSTWAEIQLLERAKAGQQVAEVEAEANDNRQMAIGLLQMGLNIGLAIVFLVWVYRACKNARALSDARMQFTPGWAVGWYFVPIANLFKPFQAMREIWKASDPDHGEDWQRAPGSPLLGFWWALWIIGNIVGQIVFRFGMRAETLEELLRSARFAMISDLLDFPLIALALAVVWKVHGMQERKQAFGGVESLPEVLEVPEEPMAE